VEIDEIQHKVKEDEGARDWKGQVASGIKGRGKVGRKMRKGRSPPMRDLSAQKKGTPWKPKNKQKNKKKKKRTSKLRDDLFGFGLAKTNGKSGCQKTMTKRVGATRQRRGTRAKTEMASGSICGWKETMAAKLYGEVSPSNYRGQKKGKTLRNCFLQVDRKGGFRRRPPRKGEVDKQRAFGNKNTVT